MKNKTSFRIYSTVLLQELHVHVYTHYNYTCTCIIIVYMHSTCNTGKYICITSFNIILIILHVG